MVKTSLATLSAIIGLSACAGGFRRDDMSTYERDLQKCRRDTNSSSDATDDPRVRKCMLSRGYSAD